MRGRIASCLVAVVLLAGCTDARGEPSPTASAGSPTPTATLDARPVQEQLMDAVREGDVTLAGLALEAGADPSLYDEAVGTGPLRMAIFRDDLAMVHLLVDAGAVVEWEEYNYSELEPAAESAGEDVMLALLATGASPDGVGELGQGIPLALAAYNDNMPALRALLEAGANPNAEITSDDITRTVIFSAANGGSVDAAIALVEAGADPSVVSSDGDTAADWAEYQGNDDVATFLRSVGG